MSKSPYEEIRQLIAIDIGDDSAQRVVRRLSAAMGGRTVYLPRRTVSETLVRSASVGRSATETARALGVSRSTVYRVARNGGRS